MRNVRPGSHFINTIFHICQFQYTHKIVSELLNHTPTKNNFPNQSLFCLCMCQLFSCVQIFATPWTVADQATLSMGFSGKSTALGNHSLLQRTFPTQESNPSLLHCRQILYHLSHQGSPFFVFILQYFPQFLILVLDFSTFFRVGYVIHL